MKYYIHVLQNYINFSGRARRTEYWLFFLFNFIFGMTASLIDSELLGRTFKFDVGYEELDLGSGYVRLFYELAVFIPALAVAVRRLHDVGKSGWFYLIILIPLVGAIWLLILFLMDSVYGPNEYGPNPKGLGNYDEIDEIGSYLEK